MNTSVCEENNYKSIYSAYSKPLRNFLYYKCGDLEKSADLSQEALIKLWENCSSVTMEKAKSFIYTIALRLMVNTIRHQKVELNFAKNNPKNATSEDPEFNLREKEFGNALQAAISDLPEIQRETFLMNRIDKLSYAEIAELLGISVKAVEKRMHNALENLRNRVKELDVYKI